MAARVSCICKYFLPTGTRCCHYYYTLKYIKKKKKKSVLQVRAALKGSSIPLVNNVLKTLRKLMKRNPSIGSAKGVLMSMTETTTSVTPSSSFPRDLIVDSLFFIFSWVQLLLLDEIISALRIRISIRNSYVCCTIGKSRKSFPTA